MLETWEMWDMTPNGRFLLNFKNDYWLSDGGTQRILEMLSHLKTQLVELIIIFGTQQSNKVILSLQDIAEN